MDFDDDLQNKEEPRPRKPRSFLLLLILIFIAIMMVVWTRSSFAPGRMADVSISEYLQEKSADRIESVTIEGDELVADMKQGGFVREGHSYKKIHAQLPPAYYVEAKGFDELKAGIPAAKFQYNKRDPFLAQLLMSIVPWVIILLVAWYFFFRQIRASGGPGNILSFGKSRARFITADKVKTTFADVAGVEEAKEEVGEIVEFLKNPEVLEDRRPDPARRPPDRTARHRQDAARQGDRGRGRRAVSLDLRLGLRRDVRRRGRVARARPVPPGEGEFALHHLPG